MKMCPLIEKVLIEQKCTYWTKMWLLKGHNPLGINSSLYSFGNFLSFIFLRNIRNLWVFSEIAICTLVFFG